MPQDDRNIYRTCRDHAGYTQEKAAELLGVSVKSIQMYESGQRIPPNDVVCNMVEVYGTPFLAFQHLRYTTEVGEIVLPDVQRLPLSKAVLAIIHELYHLQELMPTLVAIGLGGAVEDAEAWGKIIDATKRTAAAAMGIGFAQLE